MKRGSTLALVILLGFAVAVGPAFAFQSGSQTAPGKGSGNSGSAPGQSKSQAKITWEMSKTQIAEALLVEGLVSVPFRTSALIENAGFWLTPSLTDYLEVLTEPFETLEPGQPYAVEIRLKGEPPTGAIGGTLHVVPAADSDDGLRRTYPNPLAIVLKGESAGGQEEPSQPAVAVVSSASFQGDAIAPLEIVSIFGFGIGPEKFEPAIVDGNGVTDYLADVQVFFDGTAAPIIYVSSNQLNVVVPSDVAGKTTVTLTVTYRGTTWEVEGIGVAEAAPELFTMNGLGHGLVAAYDSHGQLLGENNPVAPGEWITFFGTGVGLWKDGFRDGTVVNPENLPVPKKPVKVEIGGVEAQVLYVGGAPGLVSGVVQFNVVIPSGMSLDNSTDPPSARIVVTSGGHPSKADILVWVETAPAGQ